MSVKKNGRPFLIGVLAGAIYGLWAAYANWGHDLPHVARAVSAQFALSFCSTSFLTLVIELVLRRGRSLPHLIFAATGPHAAMVTLFMTVHWLSGTPNVLKTITPSAMIGLLFCIAYVLKRSHEPRQELGPAAAAPRSFVEPPGHEVASGS
ncbi:hypothetical protein WME99_28955 [Sorangium sp. So ce136]|uniref:hypothetical protein n=1 Tax=Sorangium sp. So ce136 TaxID=3133284 RepID=UPI003F07504F